jgi:GT2 family glycosyltransferase
MDAIVSIITINYNQPELTLQFLESVSGLSYPHLEVIVVENGQDLPVDLASREAYPQVRFIDTGENLGFSGGNNVGLREARGSFFLLINNDTEVPADLIERLLERYTSTPKIGLLCPLIRYYEDRRVQYIGYTPIHPITGRNRTIGQFESGIPAAAEFSETAFAHGAAMFCSREVLENVGLMPELFFLYYEEFDWSASFIRAGYRIMVDPSVEVLHKESATIGAASPTKTYYMSRNRILYMRRNAPAWSFLLFSLFWIFVVIPVHSLRYLLKGQTVHFKKLWEATFWNLNNPSKEGGDLSLNASEKSLRA